VTDAEWALIKPDLSGAKLLGRPREVNVRAAFNAILYIARPGCQCRLLRGDIPIVSGKFSKSR
jgi:transposase